MLCEFPQDIGWGLTGQPTCWLEVQLCMADLHIWQALPVSVERYVSWIVIIICYCSVLSVFCCVFSVLHYICLACLFTDIMKDAQYWIIISFLLYFKRWNTTPWDKMPKGWLELQDQKSHCMPKQVIICPHGFSDKSIVRLSKAFYYLLTCQIILNCCCICFVHSPIH